MQFYKESQCHRRRDEGPDHDHNHQAKSGQSQVLRVHLHRVEALAVVVHQAVPVVAVAKNLSKNVDKCKLKLSEILIN